MSSEFGLLSIVFLLAIEFPDEVVEERVEHLGVVQVARMARLGDYLE